MCLRGISRELGRNRSDCRISWSFGCRRNVGVFFNTNTILVRRFICELPKRDRRRRERDVQRLYIENASLIQKANRGEKLTDDEFFILREVFQATWVQHLFAYLRSKTYGRDGSIQVRNLAFVLKKYPGFAQVFDGAEFRSIRGDHALEMISLVDKLREEHVGK